MACPIPRGGHKNLAGSNLDTLFPSLRISGHSPSPFVNGEVDRF